MKLYKNQKGFGVIESLLILVIIGLIGVVGYYVYKTNKEDIKVSDSSIQKQTAKSPAQQDDYLTVKELGIKADKSAIPGAYYKLGTNPDPDQKSQPAIPEYPEITVIDLYDRAYDNTENQKGVKCSDVEYTSPIAEIQVISEADRDAKYSKYKNADLAISQGVPSVLSDKSATKKDGLLYFYYNYEGVQAPPACIDLSGDIDVQAEIKKPGNKRVFDQLSKSRGGLEKLAKSFVKE